MDKSEVIAAIFIAAFIIFFGFWFFVYFIIPLWGGIVIVSIAAGILIGGWHGVRNYFTAFKTNLKPGRTR
jgi:hypothetical protein